MGNPKPLSKRQQQILDVVRSSVEARGFPPSMREIAAAVGLSSVSTVKHHLDALEEAGFIMRDARRPRAIELRSEGAAKKPDLAGYAVPVTVAEGECVSAPLVENTSSTLCSAVIGEPAAILPTRGAETHSPSATVTLCP